MTSSKLFLTMQKKVPNFQVIQCHECEGYGHIVYKYPNKKNKKKASTVTWADRRKRR